MRRDILAIGAMAAALAGSNLLALVLALPFLQVNARAFENPQDVTNVLIYLIIIVAFAAAVLFLVRLQRRDVVKWIILGSMFFTMFFVFGLVISLGIYYATGGALGEVGGWAGTIAGTALAALLTYALHKYPEWYVVDAVALATASGITAILGNSFGILPALVLLGALAIYDALAVYKTRHMVALADAVGGLRLPVLLVVPKHRHYSFLTQRSLKEQLEEGAEREAMFMGLGDIIVPGILVVSAFIYLQPPAFPSGDAARALAVALVTLLGCLVGFAVLMRYVLKGNPQAGLPLLNGGAVAGYFIGYLLLFQNFSFGFLPVGG